MFMSTEQDKLNIWYSSGGRSIQMLYLSESTNTPLQV